MLWEEGSIAMPGDQMVEGVRLKEGVIEWEKLLISRLVETLLLWA